MGSSASQHAVDGVGQSGFVAQHGLYTPEQQAAADELADRIRELGLRTVRLIVVDQHGIPRGKALDPAVAIAAMRNGLDFSGAIYSLDSGNQVFVPAFAAGGGFGIDELTGFPDVVLVPDPATFQVLPWADRTGWMLCDVYFSSGAPMPLDGRGLMRRQLAALGEAGFDYLAGIEVEYYIVKNEQTTIIPENAGFTPVAPAVSVLERGYQYLSEVRLDSVNSTLEMIRDGLAGVGLLPRSMEDEWGPGQMEFSFSPIGGLAAADAVVLFRSAVKQMCQRRGLLATLHVPARAAELLLLRLAPARVAAVPDGRAERVRQRGRGAVAGGPPLRGRPARARDADDLFATPTVNGYKRYRPYSFAPDRVCWAVENRGALVRVQGAPGDANSHIENRMGEPAANPYLYMAANIAAGLDGMRRKADPPPPVEADPYAIEAPMLPTSLATRSRRWTRTASTARRSGPRWWTTCSR